MDMILPDNYRVSARGLEHHFYISDEIGDPVDYIDLLDCLYKSGPDDVVTLHINTPGGCLDTVVQLYHAIKSTQAFVVTSAEGSVASGGSILFFSGHGFSVNEHALFLLHDAKGGHLGKLSDNIKAATASQRQLRGFYEAVYGPFFGEEVVNRVLDGSEEYFLGSEVIEILTDKLEQEEEEEVE